MFYDLAKVQILKGPQGTLFGRNTTGGGVLFEPARPEFALSGHVKGTLGNYSNREGEAVRNLPIIDDRLAIRLSGNIARRDGFTRSVRTEAGRAALRSLARLYPRSNCSRMNGSRSLTQYCRAFRTSGLSRSAAISPFFYIDSLAWQALRRSN
jgi:outer membrane receptor protein involved in Fe transport